MIFFALINELFYDIIFNAGVLDFYVYLGLLSKNEYAVYSSDLFLPTGIQ